MPRKRKSGVNYLHPERKVLCELNDTLAPEDAQPGHSGCQQR